MPVQLDPYRTSFVPDRQLRVQLGRTPTRRVIQEPECLPGEVAEFRMITLGLELGDDHDRQHHLVLGLNLPIAAGSASRTLVSEDVRCAGRLLPPVGLAPLARGPGGRNRDGGWSAAAGGALEYWPLALPWAPLLAPRSDTDVSAGPGPASDGPGAGPSLISPACQDAKLEDLEGLPVGRLRTARQLRPYPRSAVSRKYRNDLLTRRAGRTPVTARRRAAWRLVRSRTGGAWPHTSAVRGGNPPGGRPASRRHRNRTPNARSARAGNRPAAAPRTS